MRMYPAKEGRKEGREREGGNKGRKDTKMRLISSQCLSQKGDKLSMRINNIINELKWESMSP